MLVLFVLDIVAHVLMNKISFSNYIVESVNLWHRCLDHVGVGSINRF